MICYGKLGSMISRVFVVTGSNKGIGKAIVRNLLRDSDKNVVYLTSRNDDLGSAAVRDLESEGLKPRYHMLDVTNEQSIFHLYDHLIHHHGGFDVLVNNAGIAFSGNTSVSFADQVKATLECNFHGIIRTVNILTPAMKKNGRIVNISSVVSEWIYKKLSNDLKTKFADPNLTQHGLENLMRNFVQAVDDDQVEKKGFTKSAYGMSKVAVSFLSQIQQKTLDMTYPDKKILLNFCCPGFVSTDLTGGRGRLNVDKGAATPSFLALLPIEVNEPKGSYIKLRKIAQFPPAQI